MLEHSSEGHAGDIVDLSFDGNGVMLASAARDGTAFLWSARSGELWLTLPTGQESLRRVSLSRNGRWLASGDDRGHVRLWDIAGIRRRLADIGLDWAP
jgi:WD40 repeat protein